MAGALLAVGLLSVACAGESTQSALFEIRPVLGTPAPPCVKDKDAAKGIIVLAEPGGGCLEVGPPIVDTEDVRSAALDERDPQRPVVAVVLGRTGAATLDDFAARSLGKRLAIVVKGKLVNAPTVQAPAFIGRVAVTGLSRAKATELAEGLRRASTSR